MSTVLLKSPNATVDIFKLFVKIKATNTHGTTSGKWSARKAQLLAKKYKALGGGYY